MLMRLMADAIYRTVSYVPVVSQACGGSAKKFLDSVICENI